jgi:hypothetical protein
MRNESKAGESVQSKTEAISRLVDVLSQIVLEHWEKNQQSSVSTGDSN